MKKVILLLVVGALVALGAAVTVSALTQNPAYEYITIEAENMTQNAGAWKVADDANASGGKYIVTSAAKANSANPAQVVKYVFNVKAAGKYKVFLRLLTLTEGETSVHFILGKAKTRTEHGNNAEWFWNFLNNDNVDTPMAIDLAAGQNELQIFHREPDVRIDKIIITNDPALKAGDI